MKKHIQEELRKEMFRLVEKPKSGSGSTNDGNNLEHYFTLRKI